jgi:drug/metabolite transporter (DMT)-like permease
MSLAHWIALVLLGAIFGSAFSLNEVLVSEYGPLTVSTIRVALGALGCWLWVFTTRRTINLGGVGLVTLSAFGIFQYAAPFALIPLAQAHITSSSAGIANAMTPVAVVLVSQVWPGGEKATANKLIGVAFGVFGIVFLTAKSGEGGTSERLYIVVAALAPICYAIALNLARRFHGVDPAVLTASAMSSGVIAILPFAIAGEGVPSIPDADTAVAFAAIGFGLTAAAFLIMYSLLPKVGATNLSLVTLVAPVSAVLIGHTVFGDPIGNGHIAGMGFILLGLVTIDGRIWKVLKMGLIVSLPLKSGPLRSKAFNPWREWHERPARINRKRRQVRILTRVSAPPPHSLVKSLREQEAPSAAKWAGFAGQETF